MDPMMKYIITMSSDSTIRGYKNRKLKTQLQFFHKFVNIFSFCIIFYQTLKNREEETDGNDENMNMNIENSANNQNEQDGSANPNNV